MDRVRVSDGDMQMVFVKSGLKGREICPSLGDYNGVLNVFRGCETEACGLCEQSS